MVIKLIVTTNAVFNLFISGTASKRGTLAMLRDPTSQNWVKSWVVLRRPYLYLYESSAESEEITVINISTVRVEQSPEIEQMLEVSPRVSFSLLL